MRHADEAFGRAGLAPAVVGLGTPVETAGFVAELGLAFPVLADPERAAYRAYGLVEAGAREFLSPKAAVAMVKATAGGTHGGRPIGDVRQIGGAFAIDRVGTARWARPSAYAGDHASPEELLAAARAVGREEQSAPWAGRGGEPSAPSAGRGTGAGASG